MAHMIVQPDSNQREHLLLGCLVEPANLWPVPAPRNYPFRGPKYRLTETMRPLMEVIPSP